MKTIVWLVALVALTLINNKATADGGYLYGLNSTGIISVNGNTINNLPGGYSPSNPSLDPELAWHDLAVTNGDQTALRGDGAVFVNGIKQWSLPSGAKIGWYWTQLQVRNGSTYALREDGNLAVSNAVVDQVPRDIYYFTGLQVIGGAAYSLRSDGSIFKNNSSTPLFAFHVGSDGQAINNLWSSLKQDPTGNYLYALRTDGILYRGHLPAGATSGEHVDTFPFPNGAFTTGDLYVDLEFDDVTGTGVVLRASGMVYREPNALSEVIDLPGGNSSGSYFLDLVVFGGRYYAMRQDGLVYVEGLTNVLVNLPGGDYGHIQLSTVPPNLAGQKNNPPGVLTYTIPVNINTPVHVPVIATDVETSTPALTVTPIAVPAGAVWDAGTRVLTWTTPAVAGNYVFSYIVDDGSGSAKTYTSTFQVKLPDADPAKNKPPYSPKFKGAQALVGQEYRVYIPLNDPDGDSVTATVDAAAYPFNTGASYESATSEFVWTPTNADLGTKTVALTLSDGTTSKTLKLKIIVKSPLFIAPLPN